MVGGAGAVYTGGKEREGWVLLFRGRLGKRGRIFLLGPLCNMYLVFRFFYLFYVFFLKINQFLQIFAMIPIKILHF